MLTFSGMNEVADRVAGHFSGWAVELLSLFRSVGEEEHAIVILGGVRRIRFITLDTAILDETMYLGERDDDELCVALAMSSKLEQR